MKFFKTFFLTTILEINAYGQALKDLDALLSMHSIFMKSDAVSVKVKHTGIRRLTHWPTKRVTHAMTNLEKLKKAFWRCGSEVDSYSQISKLSNDVCEASDQILAAFSQWAETHLSACKNNQVHTKRMDTKWSNIYNEVLGCAENQSETTQSTTPSTTQSTTQSTIQSTSVTNPNLHRFCSVHGNIFTSECSHCYTYIHVDDYFYDYETSDYYYEDHTCEYTLSTVCDPNFVDYFGNDCDWYSNFCRHGIWNSKNHFLGRGVMSNEGFMIGLNCPSCGCDENGPIHIDDRNDY